ncbi:MAG: YraN family protein [Proteobacteria bacterium]|nr:YraN family protein [Pseudomonadota bacterium]
MPTPPKPLIKPQPKSKPKPKLRPIARPSYRPIPTPKKKAAHNRGVEAEAIVTKQLEQNQWQVIITRRKSPYGELDLVAEKPGRLLIVEVKATHRSDDRYIETTLPNPHECRRILEATQYLLSTNPEYADHSIEFVIAVVRKNNTVRYVKDWLDGYEE